MKRHKVLSVLAAVAGLGWLGMTANAANAQVVQAVENVLQDAGVLAPSISSSAVPSSSDFISRGETEFRAGHYTTAVQMWRHALVDDPKNGGVMMMLSQAMFAVGQYDEAAGAAQYGMSLLPPDKWGGVVQRYKELYGNQQDYTDELKRLEKARDASPEAPAIRFLLGYHFGFLGYPKQAVRELDKVLELAPKDDMARKLLEQFKPLVKNDAPAAPPSPSGSGSAQVSQ
jgi:tetratricopeptide (TPR) repeat protein